MLSFVLKIGIYYITTFGKGCTKPQPLEKVVPKQPLEKVAPKQRKVSSRF
jgi:hypothetical protein